MAKGDMRPGGGGAFKALESKLAKKPVITNPGGLAASIGRKEFGKGQFQEMAAKGKERATAKRKGEAVPKLPKFTPKKAEPGSGLAEGMKAAAKAVGKK